MPVAWAFDLDGCLVDGISATSLQPRARDVLERVGIVELIDAFYDKIPGPDGLWTIDGFDTAHIPETFVDDQPERIPAGALVLAVSPYIGVNAHNRGFAEVLDAALRIPDATTT